MLDDDSQIRISTNSLYVHYVSPGVTSSIVMLQPLRNPRLTLSLRYNGC